MKNEYKSISKKAKLLLAREEGYDVDWKGNVKILDPEDIVAFANSKDGGSILLGIDEEEDEYGRQKPKIVGCKLSDENKLAIKNKAISCIPPIEVEIIKENIDKNSFYRVDGRKSMYYYPDYQTYSFIQYNSSGTTLLNLIHYKNNAIESFNGINFIIPINSSTNNVVWTVNDNSEFFKQLQSKIDVKTMLLPDGYLLYYSEVKSNTNFTIDNITFIEY